MTVCVLAAACCRLVEESRAIWVFGSSAPFRLTHPEGAPFAQIEATRHRLALAMLVYCRAAHYGRVFEGFSRNSALWPSRHVPHPRILIRVSRKTTLSIAR